LTGDLELCVGDSVFLKVTNLNSTIPILSYSWTPTDVIYIADSASIYDFIDTSTWYSVEVINADGCIIKDSVFVNIYEYPILDSLWLDKDTVFRGETTYLNIQTANSFNWKDMSSTANRVEIAPAQKICYAVEVYNIHNCIITDSICIEVLDVFCNEDSIVVPTAFSPNEDEVNEFYFIIDVAGVVIEFKLEIFNRLGQKVFSTTDKFEKWDGTYRGKKLNPQVLDFYLELKCIGEKQLFKKGNITLIR
jgi:gliding motility-associated-like protein